MLNYLNLVDFKLKLLVLTIKTIIEFQNFQASKKMVLSIHLNSGNLTDLTLKLKILQLKS